MLIPAVAAGVLATARPAGAALNFTLGEGSIDWVGLVDFTTTPGTFDFLEPALCGSTSCTAAVASASGDLSVFAATPLDIGNQMTDVTLFNFPLTPGGPSNGPDWGLGGLAPVLDGTNELVNDFDLTQGRTLVSLDPMGVPFVTFDNGADLVDINITEVEAFKVRPLTGNQSETTVSGSVLFKSNGGDQVFGVGSLNATFLNTDTETAFDARASFQTQVPEPGNLVGLFLAMGGLGLFSAGKKAKKAERA